MKKKLVNFFRVIKQSKRALYLIASSILILFCLALNISFSAFTASTKINNANITIGKLKYKMIINNVDLDGKVGTDIAKAEIIGDRIVKLKAGATESFNIVLNSLNTINTKYEITYDICTDETCINFIENNNINFSYNPSADNVNGTINAKDSKIISLISNNLSESDYYVQININAGYSHNTLVYKNQITEESSNGITVIAYVNGEEVEAFPETDTYVANVECYANGEEATIINATASWNGAKWLINLASIDTANTICNVYFTYSEYSAPNGWFTSEEGTLLNAIKRDTANIFGEPATSPGNAVSTSTEKVLASTADDYGTSFYYRGAVDNNYVVFANMCWRIVRVTGNGSIKLTLFNRNDNNIENPCGEETGNYKAFAKYDGTNYTSKFNPSSSSNTYIGLMYAGNLSTFAETHENKIDSTILTNLKTWYDSTLRNYNEMLADTIWCNDKSLGATNNGSGKGTSATQYGAGYRIYSSTTHEPSLVCPDMPSAQSSDINLSKFTASDTLNGNGKLRGSNGVGDLEYKIGLLTIDEAAFAGGIYGKENSSNYLYANTGKDWWTSSPSHFTSGSQEVLGWAVYADGNLGRPGANDAEGVRPSISLKAATTITSTNQNGSSTNPYIIKTN